MLKISTGAKGVELAQRKAPALRRPPNVGPGVVGLETAQAALTH